MKILFVCMSQFGRLVDTYAYCRNLRSRNEITYICWDYGFPKQYVNNVNVIYVSRIGNKFRRYLRFKRIIFDEMLRQDFDVCHITNYLGCSLLKIFSKRTIFIYDIRSGAVNTSKWKRALRDWARKTEALCFKYKTIVSESLASKYGMSSGFAVITVGSDVRYLKSKFFEKLQFLYIGVLGNRRIEDTIDGFVKSRTKYPELIEKYTIIVKGTRAEIDKISLKVLRLGATGYIKILGEVPYKELDRHLETHNIGIAYVPITEYYNNQPTTKIFDYMLSGLVVLSTATKENKRVMTKDNGVLVLDNVEGVCKGIDAIVINKGNYNSDKIRSSVENFTWERISEKLEQYMKQVISKEGN